MTAKRFLPDGTPVNAHDAVSGNAALSRIIMLSDKAVFPEHGGVGIKEGNPARARPKPERAVHAKITYFIMIRTVSRTVWIEYRAVEIRAVWPDVGRLETQGTQYAAARTPTVQF